MNYFEDNRSYKINIFELIFFFTLAFDISMTKWVGSLRKFNSILQKSF